MSGDRTKPSLTAAVFFSSLLLLLLVSSSLPPLVESEGSRTRSTSEPEWQILTKRSFSSQIRLHPQILLLVALPWSGESRSLMREVSHLVANEQEEFGSLKLMVLYRNSEKLLADVLGASSEGITLFYYHRSVKYKYGGRLRAKNVLASVSHFASLRPEEVPFKALRTEAEVENFVQSTDRAVVLFEFCGWSAKLRERGESEENETALSVHNLSDDVGILQANLSSGAGGKLGVDKKANQKGLENVEVTCGDENGLAVSPWRGGFSWANQSDSQGTEYGNADTDESCTVEEFQRFESFFLKLTKIATEFFLPPERQRFGLITKRSLLLSMNVVNTEPWLLLHQFSGCANCSVIVEKVDDLKIILQTHHSFVTELDVEEHNLESTFPADKPSVILFIDRSDSPSLRRESEAALQVLRRFAQDNQHSDQMVTESDGSKSRSSLEQSLSETGSQRLPDHFIDQIHKSPKIVKIKDNMAIMIMNKGESIPLDPVASNAKHTYDLLANLLHQEKPALRTKETKISLLAKEVGFQLLSNDFEVQVVDSSPSKENDQVNDMIESTVINLKGEASELPEKFREDHEDQKSRFLLDPNRIASVDNGKQPDLSDTETDHQNQKASPFSESSTSRTTATVTKELKDENGLSTSLHVIEDVKSFNSLNLGNVKESIEKDHVDHTTCTITKTCSSEDEQSLARIISSEGSVESDATVVIKSIKDGVANDSHIQYPPSLISFFFSDGGYRLLRSLTGAAKIPSLVLLDPVQQQHYISEESSISYSSLANFIDNFLNGSLTPYRHSSSSIMISKETPKPPFVNLDFHESDSIPRVTANTFCELIMGYKPCEIGKNISSIHQIQDFRSVWKMDVLVLFSSSWCGFCQRMELVVREVYRALKIFTAMLNCESDNLDARHIEDKAGDFLLNGLPSIYLIDCTLNDCGLLLKPMGKWEIYPLLLLFPAENKSAITYEGDMSVVNIIEFLESHGKNSRSLSRNRGFLWTPTWKESKRRATLHDISSSVHEEVTYAENKYDELLLSRTARRDHHHPVESHTSNNDGQHIFAGSVIVATDKLLDAFPFNNSTILIVSVDEARGFQGIIINKRISWDIIFKELEKDLEPLKQAPLFYGGPVRAPDLPLVSLARNAMEGYTKVTAHIYFGNPLVTRLVIERIRLGDRTPSDFWFFFGYSTWGWNQLFDELEDGAWHLSSTLLEHLHWPDQ